MAGRDGVFLLLATFIAVKLIYGAYSGVHNGSIGEDRPQQWSVPLMGTVASRTLLFVAAVVHVGSNSPRAQAQLAKLDQIPRYLLQVLGYVIALIVSIATAVLRLSRALVIFIVPKARKLILGIREVITTITTRIIALPPGRLEAAPSAVQTRSQQPASIERLKAAAKVTKVAKVAKDQRKETKSVRRRLTPRDTDHESTANRSRLRIGPQEKSPLIPDKGTISLPRPVGEKEGEKALTVRELQIDGSLNNISVSAVPDTGSSFDIISEQFATANRLRIDTLGRIDFKLPNGAKRTFVGTVTAPWVFSGEKEAHKRVFHVLKDCIHQVVLGADFLDTTRTFSTFAHRIKEVISRNLPSTTPRRVLYIDQLGASASSKARLLSLCNGHPVFGLPDTCSDISIINHHTARELCQKLGLSILTDHSIEVQFIDGSTAHTSGLIKDVEWCFGVTLDNEDTRRIDLHVMDGIPCTVILDKWLLWENKVFSRYEDCLRYLGPDWQRSRDDFVLGIKRSRAPQGQANPMYEEAARRTEALSRLRKLPQDQQEASWQKEMQRRQHWHATHDTAGLSLAASSNSSEVRPLSAATTATAVPSITGTNAASVTSLKPASSDSSITGLPSPNGSSAPSTNNAPASSAGTSLQSNPVSPPCHAPNNTPQQTGRHSGITAALKNFAIGKWRKVKA
ncbi:hypothetical protein N3K66_001475 [Trichothecium roseum]|uniref:Uncharacterized protein n=1 Tax=Trichothecium roseum TaxID=47278 RepID=A0ACC0VER3_9HYPO|nr:hypothetical protein N3K66_001475 [Trichothecium roseum]